MAAAPKKQSVGEREYNIGDIVLAKIRGYPQWPGRLVDPETVSEAVARERPPSKKTKFYCVRFFPSGDFSWTVAKDLSLLQKHEIEAYINEPHKKSAELLRAYKVAMDPSSWEASLATPGISTVDDGDEVEEEVDELDDAEEDSEKSTTKTSKKRKRESETKPRKKKDISTTKAAAGGEAKEKKTPAKKKPVKKNGMRSKETVESEDEGAAASAGAEQQSEGGAPPDSSKKPTPSSKRAKKEKSVTEEDAISKDPEAIKVKEWRHKLQRAFLSKSVPKEEEMPEYDQLFTTIEKHDLTLDQLTLGKVMRHITQLEPEKLQQEEKYQIRKRADALLEKWQKFVHNASAADEGQGTNANANTSAGASVNGSAPKTDKSEMKNESMSEVAANDTKHTPNGAKAEDNKTNAVEGQPLSGAPVPEVEEEPMDTTDD
ncbi:hypothetical protein Clacol_010503 [Clathrus columnatus]|uniref:PWWP domain-containing protein n=1 Tax=Clathrus columnatus TaxID=1419009 RepID=A0AAV5AQV5_9AGAM|nr:hypothetical protein Clacol_001042 [Clathrus columnatus]GJJ16207.1 hypothetical protein Clacol_010503 [Clathrus columnatus]